MLMPSLSFSVVIGLVSAIVCVTLSYEAATTISRSK
jgi:ABC-type spermidine/putrescine transport system permease subunit I